MRSRRVGALVFATVLAACAPAGGPSPDGNPFAPSGRGKGADVDGLIVGHRLMAAGQYELALKAYYRAAAEQGVSVDTLSAIGSADLQLGRLGQAERILRSALKRDPEFVPALNNLGVVLMEQGKIGEAVQTFRLAFALDSGQSARIRENLRLALAQLDNPSYAEEDNNFALVRRGSGEYLLLSKH